MVQHHEWQKGAPVAVRGRHAALRSVAAFLWALDMATDAFRLSHFLFVRRALASAHGQVVLDLGGGGGRWRRALPGSPSLYVSVDIEQEWYRGSLVKGLKGSKARYKAGFVRGDARRIPVRNGSVDVVLCLELLEHVASPETVISEIARVLKPNGLLILTTPNATALERHRFFLLDRREYLRWENKIGHLNTLTEDEVKLWLQRAELPIVNSAPAYRRPFGTLWWEIRRALRQAERHWLLRCCHPLSFILLGLERIYALPLGFTTRIVCRRSSNSPKNVVTCPARDPGD